MKKFFCSLLIVLLLVGCNCNTPDKKIAVLQTNLDSRVFEYFNVPDQVGNTFILKLEDGSIWYTVVDDNGNIPNKCMIFGRM